MNLSLEYPCIGLDFGQQEDSSFQLLEEMTDGELSPEWQYDISEISDITNKTTTALQLIKKIYPELYSAMITIVGKLIYAKKPGFGGGTNSSIIGVIWLNPSSLWTEIDYAERIFHEYVHMCLFLDEMVNTIFTYDVNIMAKDDALITSAILKRERGYDKSFHSAFVAVAIAHFYWKLGMPSKANSFLSSSTLKTIQELKTKQRLLTDHGNYILNELDQLSKWYVHQLVRKC